MKRKNFNLSTAISAIIWAIFAGIAWYLGADVGTIATLGGIALMFAWMRAQANLSD